MKRLAPDELGRRLVPYLMRAGLDPAHGPPAGEVAGLLRERVETLREMADAAHYFYARPAAPLPEKLAASLTDPVRIALHDFAEGLAQLSWSREAIASAIKDVAARHGLKPPQVMMGLRAAVTGEPQTPAIDAIVALLGRETVRARLASLPPARA